MASINSIKASDGSGNANLATVQSTRSGGASTIIVNTVSGIPTNFHASMGTPHTFTDPVTSETITVISEATAVDFKGHVDGSNLEIDTIAPGYTDTGSAVGDIVIIKPTTQWADEVATILDVSHDDDGTLKDGVVTNAKLNTTAGELGGAWQSWTPTATNIGAGLQYARYTQIGKTVHFKIKHILQSASVAGGVTYTLPVAPRDETGGRTPINSTCMFIDVSAGATARWVGFALMGGSDDIVLNAIDTGGDYGFRGILSSTIPFAWASSDEIYVTGSYEAA